MKRGKDDEEQLEILNEYIAEPRNLNRYVYALNNPLKYTDPTGMRPPNIWEKLAFTKLDELISAFNRMGRKDLAEALANAKKEISQIIAKLAKNEDSVPVGIAVWAILKVGNKDYAKGTALAADGQIYGAGSNKCNVFVAMAHRNGGNIRAGNYPVTDGVFPVANWLGDIRDGQKLKNLPVVYDAAGVGDVVAWRYVGGKVSGHSAISIGGGVLVYAGGGTDGTPKAETMAKVNESMNTQGGWILGPTHEPGVIRRFNGKP